MLGMILLAVMAVMIFFGLTDRFFAKMGVANWAAFLIILAFAVAAVFPPLLVGRVTLSYAGFFLPLMLGTVAMFALGANSTLLRAIVGTLAVAGIVLATRVAFVPTGYSSAIPSILIIGFAGGIAAYIIAQSRLAVLASVLCGIVLGDFASAMILRFALDTGYLLQLGQNGIFDALVLSLIIGAVTLEVAAVITRAVSRRIENASSTPALASQIEAAEDVKIDENDVMLPADEDDDLFEDYFNDDID